LAKKPVIGDFVLMKQNNKIAQLTEIRGKKAVVALGAMPLQVNYDDLVAVKKKLVEDDPKTIVK
jgi:DNA mismatch repair protein MutS2